MATHSSVLALRIPGTGKPGWAAVYGVAQSQTRLKRLSSSSGKKKKKNIYIYNVYYSASTGKQSLEYNQRENKNHVYISN